MLASEIVLHGHFQELVAEFHPFAQYTGYQEGEDCFIVHYDGGNGDQAMLVDVEGNVVGDTTMGTTRSLGLLGIGAIILSAMFGMPSN